MNPIHANQVAPVIQGRIISGESESSLNGVSIDSRTIQPGQVFFAIPGENFDGHRYAAKAIEKGASCAVVEHEIALPQGCPVPVIQVDDSIAALGQFSKWYRQQLRAKVIAITGSVGKTTTRQILHQILSRFYTCRQAQNSFNNHIGVPLTILSAEAEDDILLLELGSNHPGEIEPLTAIANPDMAVITTVAPSHLEGFGTLDTIIKEKTSIASGLRQGGKLYTRGDRPDLLDCVRKHFDGHVVTFGESRDCDVRGVDLLTTGDRGTLTMDGQVVHVPLAGKANLLNVLTAWAVCRDLGIGLPDFIQAVETLRPIKMRLAFENIGPLLVLDDCYNANPVSMSNALSCLSSMAKQTGRRTVFIAGCMAELGRESASLHEQLGQEAVSEGVQALLAAGPFARQILQGASADPTVCWADAFENTEQLCDNLHKWIEPDDIILVKGSRSAHLEKAVQRLRELFGNS
jgi:UDP-N-acetylmuramoyl-tripeptide--D-alanyl-D-alanine ligase